MALKPLRWFLPSKQCFLGKSFASCILGFAKRNTFFYLTSAWTVCSLKCLVLLLLLFFRVVKPDLLPYLSTCRLNPKALVKSVKTRLCSLISARRSVLRRTASALNVPWARRWTGPPPRCNAYIFNWNLVGAPGSYTASHFRLRVCVVCVLCLKKSQSRRSLLNPPGLCWRISSVW